MSCGPERTGRRVSIMNSDPENETPEQAGTSGRRASLMSDGRSSTSGVRRVSIVEAESRSGVSGGCPRWQGPQPKMDPTAAGRRQNASDENADGEFDPIQLSPFALRSCFGASTVGFATSAALRGQPAVLYAASHAAVLMPTRSQHAHTDLPAQLLQGHKNAVRSMASDATGRWVATGDAGADNALIVWDTNKCVPVFSVFDWCLEGCRFLALSADALLLVAVSDAVSPLVAVFRWTLGPEKPDATATLSEFGLPNHLTFSNTLELMVTSASSVAFVFVPAYMGESGRNTTCPENEQDGLRAERPELPKSAGARCSRLVASAFVPPHATATGRRIALTATARGSIVVWALVDAAWTLFKEVQAQRDPITAILVSPTGVVVTGNAKGQLRFYDAYLRVLYWWQTFTLDSITSLRFHTCASHAQDVSRVSLEASRQRAATERQAAMQPSGAFDNAAVAVLRISTSESSEEISLQNVNYPVTNQRMSLSNAPHGRLSGLQLASFSVQTMLSGSNALSPSAESYYRENRSASIASRGTPVGQVLEENEEVGMLVRAEMMKEQEKEEAEEEAVAAVHSDATLQHRPFYIDDLLVCSLNGDIGTVCIGTGHYERIIMGGVAITALDSHPEKSQVVTGSRSGELRLYSYSGRGELLVYNELSPAGGAVTALRYAPSGLLLVAGRENGVLTLVEPVTLVPFAELRHLISDRPVVRLLEFSYDSQILAAVDDSMALTVWTHRSSWEIVEESPSAGSGINKVGNVPAAESTAKHTRLKEPPEVTVAKAEAAAVGWHHEGKLRAHYCRVISLIFSPDGTRILTLAEDRALAECGVGPDGLHLVGLERVEQSAVPCAMIWAPRLQVPEPLLLISNNELKLKMVSDTTRMCTSTVLAPNLGSPVRLMQLVMPRSWQREAVKHSLLVAAGDRQLGLQLLPSDGNPFKCVSVIGHPEQLTQICMSNDSQYVFTIGRDDPCMLQWKINPRAVEVSTRMAGPGLAPFFALLPGGPDGWLLQEMQDMFIYAQLLHQGESSPAPRRLIDSVPVCELPDLMRAIGFFPSEYEIENLLHEVNLGPHGISSQPSVIERVKFDHFVRLFINHSPVLGFQSERLHYAFSTFADTNKGNVRRETLVNALVEHGEGLTRDQVLKYLSVLLRKHGTKGAEDDLETFFCKLSPELTYAQFRDEILGIIYELPASAVQARAHAAAAAASSTAQSP